MADLETAVRHIGVLAGQSAAIASLLFYFGWVRTRAALSHFGIDGEIARLSVTDYILRSLDVTVRPLVAVGVVALAALAAHWLLRRAGRPRLVRAVAVACAAAGLLVIGAGVLGYFNVVVYSTTRPVVPLLLAAGLAATVYGVHLLGPPREEHAGTPRWAPSFRTTVFALVLTMLGFWAVSVEASAQGREAALRVERTLASRPHVVVYSERSLGLAGPGVVPGRQPAGDRYRYRYEGLALLLHSGGRYFLLPDGWRRGPGRVLLVEEGPGLRFEFQAP